MLNEINARYHVKEKLSFSSEMSERAAEEAASGPKKKSEVK